MCPVSPYEEICSAARVLAEINGVHCLVVNAPMHPPLVYSVKGKLISHHKHLQVVLRSSGGCPCCGYTLARELRRKAERLTVYVPLSATSAATLVALAADELVVGDMGQLGPLDPQISNKQKADFPIDCSALERLQALDLFRTFSRDTFDEIVRVLVDRSGMRGEDVFRMAAEFTSRLLAPVASQIELSGLIQSVRQIEVASEYTRRILRRYRPDFFIDRGERVIERLMRGYPSHGFVIDREELAEIGLPARAPHEEAEVAAVDVLAAALLRFGEGEELVEVFWPADEAVASESAGAGIAEDAVSS